MIANPVVENTEMVTVEITLPKSVAERYQTASPAEKQQIERRITILVNSLDNDRALYDSIPPTNKSLKQVMNELSSSAWERGMTPEILENILADDPDNPSRPIDLPTLPIRWPEGKLLTSRDEYYLDEDGR